jgi:putative mRNA 3-end processing factor
MQDLVIRQPHGLYCPPGDFYIDPWRPVPRAVITHAHADHARAGHGHVLATAISAGVLRSRLGASLPLQGLAYGEVVVHNGVRISLHPAGHVLGSAQVRLAHAGRVWVASGDYYLSAVDERNPTCEPFEPLRCDCFITESTFGLPIYRWAPQAEVFDDINRWWRSNAACGRPSLLLAYSFGKAQRVLAGLDASIGPVVVHGAVAPLNEAYRAAGVALPPTVTLAGLSDHADWPGLQRAILATGAERVIVTHGQEAVMVRWLQEQGLQAGAFHTEYGAEGGELPPDPAAAASPTGSTAADGPA